MKKATVNDIAKATGYSRVTVYAALKNSPNSSQKVREIIQKKAKELGFTIDPVFSELGRRRWVNTTSHAGANIAFFTSAHHFKRDKDALNDLSTYAQSKGYSLSIYKTSKFKSTKQANREFNAKGIRGLAASCLDNLDSGEFISKLDLKHIAIITGEMNTHLFHSITWNWAFMVSKSIEELVQRGYKNISVFLYKNTPLRFYDEERIGAVLSAKLKFSVQINLHLLDPAEENTEPSPTIPYKERQQQRLKIIKKYKPDAVLAWSEEEYWEFHGAGYRMPQDFAFISLIAGIECSGMQIEAFSVWKLEVDRVIELIRNQEFGYPETPIISLYTPKFIDHGTI